MIVLRNKPKGRAYQWRGQKPAEGWYFQDDETGKTFQTEEEVKEFLNPTPKKKVARKKAA